MMFVIFKLPTAALAGMPGNRGMGNRDGKVVLKTLLPFTHSNLPVDKTITVN